MDEEAETTEVLALRFDEHAAGITVGGRTDRFHCAACLNYWPCRTRREAAEALGIPVEACCSAYGDVYR